MNEAINAAKLRDGAPSLTESERGPPLQLLLRELGVLVDWARGAAHLKRGSNRSIGRGLPVMTVPGFMVDDNRLRLLRLSLNAAGFRAHRWKRGRNFGVTPDILERMGERVEYLVAKHRRPIALVGWSLGGIYAREYAKRHPENVSRVITMGTPFSGSPRANNVWRLYEVIAKHKVDAPPVELLPMSKPPVPTIALWSPNDGVIMPQAAQGTESERDLAVELSCGHMGFVCAPEAIEAIIAALVEPLP